MKLDQSFLTIPLAHRGLHDGGQACPENTLGAARAAIDAGYGIEVDLQLSRDGVAMVFHDDRLDRLTAEKGWVRDADAMYLKRLQVLQSQERIPTLRDLLDLVRGAVPLLLEAKDQSEGKGSSDGRLEAAIAKELTGYRGPIAVMSFNPDIVAGMANLAPRIARGLTTCDFAPELWPDMPRHLAEHLKEISDFDRVGADFISHDHSDLSADRVQHLKAKGAGILCWTVRSEEQEHLARRVADNITFESYGPRGALHSNAKD